MGITLGGFQVFDTPTFIPLRGLTFLFGPNSAGKSAVEDAIQLIFEIFPINSPNESWTVQPDPDRLKRHWRRLNEDNELDSYAPNMALGVTVCLLTDLTGALESYVNRPLNLEKLGSFDEFSLPHKIDFLATFRNSVDPHTEEFEFAPKHDLVISIDEKPIILFEDSFFKLNFSHHVLAAFELQSDFSTISLEYPQCLDYKDGWITIPNFHAGNVMQSLLDLYGAEPPKSLNLDAHITFCEQLFETSSIQMDLENAISEIHLFANELQKMILGNLRLGTPSVVAASRMIPTINDLIFFHGSFPIKNTGDEQYNSLIGIKSREVVNHMLSEHLFIERGYQLDCDHRILISPDDYSTLEDAIENGEDIYQLRLMDAQKRVFEFEEVGSGLGYVLPILTSACNGNKLLSILQQPELHLHPALQSALGDVFINCLSISQENRTQSYFGKQLVIETHSEHLLLRILKRIRQTNSNRPPTAELQINASDVAVLYFDPSPDGTTRVKNLRISDDGEFIDRWPRGFFTEREQDLFDE